MTRKLAILFVALVSAALLTWATAGLVEHQRSRAWCSNAGQWEHCSETGAPYTAPLFR